MKLFWGFCPTWDALDISADRSLNMHMVSVHGAETVTTCLSPWCWYCSTQPCCVSVVLKYSEPCFVPNHSRPFYCFFIFRVSQTTAKFKKHFNNLYLILDLLYLINNLLPICLRQFAPCSIAHVQNIVEAAWHWLCYCKQWAWHLLNGVFYV